MDQLSLKPPNLAESLQEMDSAQMRPQHEGKCLPYIWKVTQEMKAAKAEERAEQAVLKANNPPETLTFSREAGGPILDLHAEPVTSSPVKRAET